ncbi:hypothetical protein N2W54_003134 [Lotmaria passim]
MPSLHCGAGHQAPPAAFIGLRRLRFLGATCPTRQVSTATTGSSTPSAPPNAPAARPTFCSATKFKLTAAQVNETNVPSAKEVGQMIPTLRELHAQLPDAHDLEHRYIHAATPADTAKATASASSIFQKTTDPLEDLLFGPPKEEVAAAAAADEAGEGKRSQRQHLLLAYRALLWGTAYAVLGFLVTVVGAMYACGYHAVGELLDGVREKVHRDEERLRVAVGGDVTAAGSSPVEHYVIDLTHPTETWRQVQEVWSAVQRLAEEEDTKAQRSAPS